MKASKAVFRRFDFGEVIALFFDETNAIGETKAYLSGEGFFYVDYGRVLRLTKPTTARQRKAVFVELQGLGLERIEVYRRARPKD